MDLRDFKRIYQIAAFILIVVNIYKGQSKNTIELTTVMYIISNMLTVQGIRIRDKYQSKQNNRIRKTIEYFIWISGFILFIDEAQNFNWDLNILKGFIWFIIVVTFLYCIVLTFISLTEKEAEAEIRTEVKELYSNFDVALKEVVKAVNEQGGWNKFIKTKIGQQFAESVRMKTNKKHPTDFKKHHKKVKRG